MFTQPKWFREIFALSHACAGVCVYCLAIIVANLDKSLSEASILVARQAVPTFILTGSLVPWVQRRAMHTNWSTIIFYGIVVPAGAVAVASVTAHWYWTDEVRNILVPFTISVVLNSFLVSARRAGHETFTAQTKWFLQLVRLSKQI